MLRHVYRLTQFSDHRSARSHNCDRDLWRYLANTKTPSALSLSSSPDLRFCLATYCSLFCFAYSSSWLSQFWYRPQSRQNQCPNLDKIRLFTFPFLNSLFYSVIPSSPSTWWRRSWLSPTMTVNRSHQKLSLSPYASVHTHHGNGEWGWLCLFGDWSFNAVGMGFPSAIREKSLIHRTQSWNKKSRCQEFVRLRKYDLFRYQRFVFG
jgi:hypothetical protein